MITIDDIGYNFICPHICFQQAVFLYDYMSKNNMNMSVWNNVINTCINQNSYEFIKYLIFKGYNIYTCNVKQFESFIQNIPFDDDDIFKFTESLSIKGIMVIFNNRKIYCQEW